MHFPVAHGQRPPATASPPSWPRPSGQASGNNLPPVLGPQGPAAGPGPAPPGQVVWGQLGAPPGTGGSMPGAPQYPVGHSPGMPGRQQESAWRGGANTGWNDRLITRDRHAYWDAGTQRTGNHYSTPGNPPNPVTDGPARPDLRLTQRTISYQKGSDASAAQDDLTRPYSRNGQGMYVGEQGSGWSPVYGGVPGLYQPYGTRGGLPYPIVAPVEQGQPGDGPRKVFSGPPHGLHSLTFPSYSPTLGYYLAQPQMHQPRQDRPSNSPQAGQSYSQLVVPQGAQQVAQQQPGTVVAARAKWSAWMPGSTGGWRGASRGGR